MSDASLSAWTADSTVRARKRGPLPAAVQNYTAYDAALMSGARSPDAARMVLRELAAPTSRALFTAAGIE